MPNLRMAICRKQVCVQMQLLALRNLGPSHLATARVCDKLMVGTEPCKQVQVLVDRTINAVLGGNKTHDQ